MGRWGVSLVLVSILLAACPTQPNSGPAPKWDPVCHCLVAQFSPSVTRNFPPVISTRRGVPPTAQWPDPGPQANVPGGGGILIPHFPFPAVDVTESASMGPLIAPSHREGLQFFAVGPNLATLPPGGVAPGSIAIRTQDATGALSGFATLGQGVPTNIPGGPLGSTKTRNVNALRISAATAGTHTYLCAVDDQGHLDIAERAGQPAVDSSGAPILESAKWAPGGNLTVIWTDLNLTLTGVPSNRFVDVACAASAHASGSLDELHVLAVTDDGKAWHSLATRPWSATAAGSFSQLAQVPSLPTDLRTITAAANEDQLHVVALSKDRSKFGGGVDYGQPWHIIRSRASGSWSGVTNVRDRITSQPQARGFVDVAAAFCNEGVVAPGPQTPRHLNVALLVSGGSVDMTVHTSWSQAWGPGGANSSWLHGSQWDGALDVAPSNLTPAPQVLVGITLSERPFPPF